MTQVGRNAVRMRLRMRDRDPGGAGWKAFAWNIYGAAPVWRTAGRNLFGGNRPDDRHGKGVTG